MVLPSDIADLRDVQEMLMPNRCTVLTATTTQDRFANDVTTYSGSAYDADDSIACRIEAGVTLENQTIAERLGTAELWTVTVPALTAIALGDRLAVLGFAKLITVQSVSDGGSYETGLVCICSAVT